MCVCVCVCVCVYVCVCASIVSDLLNLAEQMLPVIHCSSSGIRHSYFYESWRGLLCHERLITTGKNLKYQVCITLFHHQNGIHIAYRFYQKKS